MTENKNGETEMTVEEKIESMGYENVVILKNPDYEGAFVGMTSDGRAVYDYNMMVMDLMETDGMDDLEAMEFIDYNTIRALPYFESEGNGAPVIIYKWED